MTAEFHTPRDLDPRELCVIRLSSIGDVCNAVPAIQAIRDRFPDARITWIIGRAEAGLVADMPGIEFEILDKAAGLAGLVRLARRLRGRRFDALLNMQVSLRAGLASLAVRARHRYGFDRARSREGHGLFCNLRIEPQQHAHVVDGFAAFARAIGVEAVPPRWEIPVGADEEAWAAQRVPGDRPVLAIVPAASAAERNWTPAGYAAVADHAAAAGLGVMLLGGPGAQEQDLADRVARLMTASPTNLVGQTSLKQMLAVLSRSAALLAPDTGPVHLAVSVGVPVIGLYCHSNPRRTGPYGGQEWVVNHYDRIVAGQRGRPWEELPWGTRAKGEGLMAGIQVKEVTDVFDRLVRERGIAG